MAQYEKLINLSRLNQFLTKAKTIFAPKITASGILKGDGAGNVSAATAGTDYLAPSALTGYRTAAAQDVIDAGKEASILGNLAMIESSPATQAHAVGEYIVYNGQLYKVTAAISAGESLTLGTNVESTMVSDQFKIRTGTYTLDSGISVANWGSLHVIRYGNVVVVNGIGLRRSDTQGSTGTVKGINVPWRAVTLFTTSFSKNVSGVLAIYPHERKVRLFNWSASNGEAWCQLIYFTDDP